ncbi:MAG TPA: hypothetical protein VIM88_08735 [Sulfurovum sp.]|uniref:hypothetical protein n=1 Tax=Sulfurovum sp. TaxID=1969726 RepID=UPI002F93A687
MRRNLIIAAVIALGFSGCTSSMDHLITEPTRQTAQTTTIQAQPYEAPSGAKKEAYENTMRKIAAGIQDDPNYQRISLNTPEKKEWFKSLTYRLWDRQITRYTFMSEALAKYPDHKYEFNFILRGFTFN